MAGSDRYPFRFRVRPDEQHSDRHNGHGQGYESDESLEDQIGHEAILPRATGRALKAASDFTENRRGRRRPLVRQTAGVAPVSSAPSGRDSQLDVALLPLRVFLGVTFCFAGLQKLANPNFFRAASPSSIQAQLVGALHSSPIHPFLGDLVHLAVPLGIVIALGELAIGLGVLAGTLTRVAAVAGMVLSLGLFLTVSFHDTPYYTGSDIVFLLAFSPLAIAGAGRRFTVTALLERQAIAAATAASANPKPVAVPTGGGDTAADEGRRRLVLTGVAVAALSTVWALAGGLAAGVGRAIGGTKAPSSQSILAAGSSSGTPAPETPGAGDHGGVEVGLASQVPVGGAASFKDPATGDPAVVVRSSSTTFLAFDAVCPHAGCTVAFDHRNDILVCPCHGSQFNASTGSVETGPAVRGLRPIAITESGGVLYTS